MLRGRSDDQVREAGEGERRQRRIKSTKDSQSLLEELKRGYVI